MKHHLTSPWSDTIEETAQALSTSPSDGLSDTEAKERLKHYGHNIFEATQVKSPLSILLNQFVSPLIIILCVAVVITATLQE